MSSICVLGNFVVDTSFYADKLPSKGQTIFGTGYQVGPGGKGSNQAIAAARLGSKVNFLGKIGDDKNGKMALELYKKNNIDIKTVFVSKEHPTGVAGIMINKSDGTNAIVVYPGASMEITINEVNKFSELILNSRVFLTQLEIKKKVILHSLKIAKKGGAITILNPAPAIEIEDEFFKYIDFFTPNETEAEFYFGKKIETYKEAKEAGDFFLEKGVQNSIITLGDKGIYFTSKNENFSLPALDLKSKVVDTTGAGDAFSGALASALEKKMEIKKSLNFAIKASGFSTMKKGAAEAMPTLKELIQ
ncbi:MAG: ribokinase [Pelagibacterales bacterium]|nr:ribokinase [Pelagibacterales bacterium]